MGARRTFTVLLVGAVVVAASGFATAPGGVGGPTMTLEGTERGGGAIDNGNAAQSAEQRLDGPDDTLRAKLRPETDAAAQRIRSNVSIRHEFGDVLTANVTGAQYRAFDSDAGVEVSPVQRVRLAQSRVDVTWDDPTDGATVSGSTDVTIDVDAYYDDAESVTWSVDGGSQRDTGRYPWTTIYGAEWDTTDVADGTHELTAHVEMESGETVTRTVSVTVDNGGDSGGDPGDGDTNDSPDVSWSQPAAGSTVSDDVPLEISASDADGSVSDVTWAVNGGSARSASEDGSGTWTATWDASGASAGTHELTATVTDDDGATAQAMVQVEVSEETSTNDSPTVSWQSPTDGDEIDGSTAITIDANDPDGSVDEVTWSVDGGSDRTATYDSGADAWTASLDASTLSGGSHDLTAVATDDSGATSETTVTVQVPESTPENEAPTISWTAPSDGESVEGTTSLSIEASDPDGSVEHVRWRVGDGSDQSATYDSGADAWTATWDAASAGGGTHELTARARDDDGATSTATISVDVAGENAAPTVTWLSPSTGERVQGETTLTIAAADDDGSIESLDWRVDDGSLRSASPTGSGTWETTWDASSVSPGSHELTAIVSDDDGVQSSASIGIEVISELQPPSVSWSSPAEGTTVSGTVPIEIDASDPDGTVEEVRWAAEGMDPQQATKSADGTWTAELNASGVLSGEYQLGTQAIDDDGLISNDTISVTVESPNRSPNVSWHAPHDGETVQDTVDVQIEAGDADGSVETVQFGIDGEFGPRDATLDSASGFWEGTFDASNLEDGTYTLRTRVVDSAGTEETATVDIDVDSSNQAPTVDWDTPTDGDTLSGEVDLRFTASDPDGNLDQVRWTVNEETPREPESAGGNEYVGTVDTTQVPDGEYTLRAGAVDEAGANTVEKIQVEVDNEQQTEPTVSWNWPEDGAVLAPHEVPIKIAASVQGDSIDRVRWQVDRGSPRSVEYNSNSGNYEATWDASTVSSGTHELRTRVQTEAGQTAMATIEVTVTQGGEGQENGSEKPSSPVPYGVERIYSQAGGPPSGGDGVDVAVLDSGIDVDHPDLQSSFTRCLDVAETGSCQDQNGHGTHVAGLVAADGSGGLTGVAPGVNLHAYKVVDRGGWGHADDVAAAIHDAAQNDVEIVVLSARTEARGSLVEREIAEHSDDLLVVAAAGNQGPDTGTIAPPAAAPEAVAVGALDQNGMVVDASSRGITAQSFCADCRDRMELAAAGANVESTWYDGGYNTISGTSVAAPQVAGVAAKAWASGRADTNGDGEVTPGEVRSGLHELARDVQDGQHAGQGYDAASGLGIPVVPAG